VAGRGKPNPATARRKNFDPLRGRGEGQKIRKTETRTQQSEISSQKSKD